MANHLRRQIREAATTLVTGLGTTGARAFASRVYAVHDSDLPCLLVNTDDESTSPEAISSLILERTLELRIRALGKANTDLDDQLDQIVLEVERVLNGSTLSGLCKPLVLQGIQVRMDDTQDKPVGYAEITYQATYFTEGAAPDTPL